MHLMGFNSTTVQVTNMTTKSFILKKNDSSKKAHKNKRNLKRAL